ncbi:hypothetical protein [Streptomyces sp. EWL5.16]|uniref:hypothetical protein n=1 Tax=Streptomyces sp. EWL5.16 TaxID=3461011 RepID=UPI0040410913
MSTMTLKRTEYRNPGDNTIRDGDTGHGESLTDIENYLLPLDELRSVGLYGAGVADGLRVSAATGQPGIKVSTGTALDTHGRVIALTEGGLAVVDPNAAPDQLEDVPTVAVDTDGLTLNTAGVSGDLLVTVTWREVLGSSTELLHAPWLRLLPASDTGSAGEPVVLAEATIDSNGLVTALTAGRRQTVRVSAARLELRASKLDQAPTPTVGDTPGAELTARTDGGLDLSLLPSDGARQVMSVQGGTGRLGVRTRDPAAAVDIEAADSGEVALRVNSSGPDWGSGLQLTNSTSGGRTYGMYAGSDGEWHFVDQETRADRLVIDAQGHVVIGTASGQSRRLLQVEGSEIHSGGSGAGFSFANRQANGLVDKPVEGERWVWYASEGTARLWSGSDLLTVNATQGQGCALDVTRRMRVRQGDDSTAGVWLYQEQPKTDRGFIGMADDDHVGLYGVGCDWGLKVDVNSGQVTFGKDVLTISPDSSEANPAALDVARRIRLRQGGDDSAGLWLYQDQSASDRAFVGMADDDHVGFFGIGCGWGLKVDVRNGHVGFANDFGQPDGPSTMSLWGSRIGDTGNGVLFISSGGGVIDVSGRSTRIHGDLDVAGRITKCGDCFKIDHPLDPANKYLSHAVVESPDMLNVYSGTAVTDTGGEATVHLPEYFEALNGDYRYQLTPVGEMAQAVVSREIRDNSFTIRTDKPTVTVSWQVTGVRRDRWAIAHRLVTETEKTERERGYYLTPDVHGQPQNRSIHSLAGEPGAPDPTQRLARR